MQAKEAIEKRRSVRTYTTDAVPVTDIKEIVQYGTMAPSINNAQPWRFIAITNKVLLTEMAEIVDAKLAEIETMGDEESEKVLKKVQWFSTFFKDAPAVIAVVLKNYTTVLEKAVKLSHQEINELRNQPDIQSMGACIQNMLLAATDMGYGSCWLSAPSIAAADLNQKLNITTNEQVFAFVTVGKTTAKPKPPQKKPLNEIFETRD